MKDGAERLLQMLLARGTVRYCVEKQRILGESRVIYEP